MGAPLRCAEHTALVAQVIHATKAEILADKQVRPTRKL
jgi:hypothetical protein